MYIWYMCTYIVIRDIYMALLHWNYTIPGHTSRVSLSKPEFIAVQSNWNWQKFHDWAATFSCWRPWELSHDMGWGKRTIFVFREHGQAMKQVLFWNFQLPNFQTNPYVSEPAQKAGEQWSGAACSRPANGFHVRHNQKLENQITDFNRFDVTNAAPAVWISTEEQLNAGIKKLKGQQRGWA